MALAASVTDQYFNTKRLVVIGTITASGSYTTGGDTLSLAGLVKGSGQLPTWCEIQGISGFTYAYVAGTSQATGKMKVFVEQTVATNTPLAEHSAASYVSGVTSDTITFYAEFKLR